LYCGHKTSRQALPSGWGIKTTNTAWSTSYPSPSLHIMNKTNKQWGPKPKSGQETVSMNVMWKKWHYLNQETGSLHSNHWACSGRNGTTSLKELVHCTTTTERAVGEMTLSLSRNWVIAL
jgi:hypothetical protein